MPYPTIASIYVSPTIMAVLSASCISAHLIFTTAAQEGHYYYVHFIDEETKAQKEVKGLPLEKEKSTHSSVLA